MKKNMFVKLLSFLRQLHEAKISYKLRHSRPDAIMVEINVPGESWEVEFLEEAELEIERFRSDGEIRGESILQELFTKYSDAEGVTEKAAT